MSENNERLDRADRIRELREGRRGRNSRESSADPDTTDESAQEEDETTKPETDGTETAPEDSSIGQEPTVQEAQEHKDSPGTQEVPVQEAEATETKEQEKVGEEKPSVQETQPSESTDQTREIQTDGSQQTQGMGSREETTNEDTADQLDTEDEEGPLATAQAAAQAAAQFEEQSEEEIDRAETTDQESESEDSDETQSTRRTDDSTSETTKEEEEEEETRVLEFFLGDERYCIDIDFVEEIVRSETITRVPNTPDHVRGVVDLRGQITTILDPKIATNIESDNTDQLIIVFDAEKFEEHGNIGWVVDGVNQVEPIIESDVKQSPVQKTHINGVIERDDEFVIWTTPELALDLEEE